MKTFVKICGITNIVDAMCASNAGADALGFVFHRESPRYVTPDTARRIVRKLPSHIITVGVFVEHSRDTICSIIAGTGIHIVQLHGDQTPEECEAYPPDIGIWKTIRNGKEPADTSALDGYTVDAFVFDTFDPARYGGTGKTGNWDTAGMIASKHRLILAGGIGPDNIARALETVKPYGIDVSSGVESRPGKKDESKLRRLFSNIS